MVHTFKVHRLFYAIKAFWSASQNLFKWMQFLTVPQGHQMLAEATAMENL
jgi:hypothetical protein